MPILLALAAAEGRPLLRCLTAKHSVAVHQGNHSRLTGATSQPRTKGAGALPTARPSIEAEKLSPEVVAFEEDLRARRRMSHPTPSQLAHRGNAAADNYAPACRRV